MQETASADVTATEDQPGRLPRTPSMDANHSPSYIYNGLNQSPDPPHDTDESREPANKHVTFVGERPAKSDDNLGRQNFAEKIANNMIKSLDFDTPSTIGIFAPWGSGKTQFINLIKNHCEDKIDGGQYRIAEQMVTCCYRNQVVWWCKLLLWAIVMITLTLAVIGSIIFLFVLPSILPPVCKASNVTSQVTSLAYDTTVETLPEKPGIDCTDPRLNRYLRCLPLTGTLGIVALVLVVSCCHRQCCCRCLDNADDDSEYDDVITNDTKAPTDSDDACGSDCCLDTKTCCYMPFFNPPEIKYAESDPSEADSNKGSEFGAIRVITVDFNAWEYSGCDILWAGIVTTLGNRVEQFFGQWRVRLCRLLLRLADTGGGENTKSYALHLCGMKITCYRLMLLAFSVLAIAVTALAVTRYTDVMKESGVWVAGTALLLTAGPLITALAVVVKTLRTSTESMVNQISKDMRRENFEEELGFMHRIKEEVHLITNVVNYMSRLHDRTFRVLLVIDDLDRCQPNRIMSVLEAVTLLLDAKDGVECPYVSILAIDPRIILGAIEQHFDPKSTRDYTKANVNGYEYLKKIIHMPFCLPPPKVSESINYIETLLQNKGKRKRVTGAQSKALAKKKRQNKQKKTANSPTSEPEPTSNMIHTDKELDFLAEHDMAVATEIHSVADSVTVDASRDENRCSNLLHRYRALQGSSNCHQSVAAKSAALHLVRQRDGRRNPPMSTCPISAQVDDRLVATDDMAQIVVGEVPPASVGLSVSFTIEAVAVRKETLDIVINDGAVKADVTTVDGVYVVTFVPVKCIVHKIDIRFNGQLLPCCPIYVPVSNQISDAVDGNTHHNFDSQSAQGEETAVLLDAFNLDCVVVSNIHTGITGCPVQFTIDATMTCKGQLELTVNDGSDTQVTPEVKMPKRGLYVVQFKPIRAQDHVIRIHFNGRLLPCCPLRVAVKESEVESPLYRELQGDRLDSAGRSRRASDDPPMQSQKPKVQLKIELMDFIRKKLKEERMVKLLHPNPRSMKRICNIMVLALSLFENKILTKDKMDSKEFEHAFEILLVVVMVEQWPFRTCFLLQYYMHFVQTSMKPLFGPPQPGREGIEILGMDPTEDARSLQDVVLIDKWTKVKHITREVTSWESFVTYDWDPELFQVFIDTYRLTFKHLAENIRFAVNHDANIESIVEQGLAEWYDKQHRQQTSIR